MQGPRDQLLAGARFALHQHRGFGGREPLDLPVQPLHGRRAADQEGRREQIDHPLAWFERFAYLAPGLFQLCTGRVYDVFTLQNSSDHALQAILPHAPDAVGSDVSQQ